MRKSTNLTSNDLSEFNARNYIVIKPDTKWLVLRVGTKRAGVCKYTKLFQNSFALILIARQFKVHIRIA